MADGDVVKGQGGASVDRVVRALSDAGLGEPVAGVPAGDDADPPVGPGGDGETAGGDTAPARDLRAYRRDAFQGLIFALLLAGWCGYDLYRLR